MGSIPLLPIPELFDLLREALDSRVDSLHRSLAAWTLLVAVGLILEYAPDLVKLCGKKQLEEHPWLWMRVYAFAGPILVTAGVAGELFVGAEFGLAEVRLRAFENLTNEQFRKTASEANRLALAAEANLAGALANAESAKATAKGFESKIADADARAAEARQMAEEERLARVRIEERLGGWRLDTQARQRLVEKLKPYAGTPFDLAVNPAEALFLDTLDGILGSAKWVRKIPKAPDGENISILLSNKAGINFSSGLTIEVAKNQWKEFGAAFTALVRGLNFEGIPAHGNVFLVGSNTEAIHIIIGNRQ